MTTTIPAEGSVLNPIPQAWRSEVTAQLTAGENTVAAVKIDLDANLHFAEGLIVISDRRIIARAPGEIIWQDWLYRDGLLIKYHDGTGVNYLDLADKTGRLARWNFTPAQNLSTLRAIEQFESHLQYHLSGQKPGHTKQTNCPSCKTMLKLDHEECPVCSINTQQLSPASSLFRLWRFAKPYRNQLMAGIILTLLGTAAGLVPPYLTMPLMDNVLIPYQNGLHIAPSLVVFYLSGLLGASLLAWALSWSKTYILAIVSERIGANMRTATYEHLLGLSLNYFGGKRTGDLISRISSESDRICVFLSVHLLDFVTDVLMMAMTIPVLFYIDSRLALAALIPLPFIAWMIHKVRDRLRTGFEKIDRVWAEITNVLADTIPGIRVVKAFAQEGREAARFRKANRHNLIVNDKLNKSWSLFYPSVSLFTDLGVLVVWAFGIWQVSRGEIKVGVLVAFIAYIGRFYGRLSSMSRIVSVTQKSASATKRIFDVLDHVASVPEPKEPVHIEQVKGLIEISNLTFRYGQRAVNRNINLTIRPGEMIGLVGHSGAGKSTLVNLICRFYDVAEGSIRVDGVDIRSFPVAEYRRNIGLVPQEPLLFFGTIAENLAYGKPDATHSEIIAAARAANAHEFILRLPQGYESIVGERGQRLSGGERQRISIARALLVDPRILILDEATSSVDTKTEYEIQKALENLTHGRTTIAIAHRLSTLHRADRIVVLDEGRIVEVGCHDELMTKKGAYYLFYKEQIRNASTEPRRT